MNDKRGISGIIVALILILLALVAAGVVWVVVRNVLNQGSDDISLNPIFLSLDIQKANVNGNNIIVTVKRNQGGGSLTGIAFVISDGSNSETIQEKTPLTELETKTFTLTPETILAASATKVSVAAIYQKSSGAEETGNILDTQTIGTSSGGGESCTPYTCLGLGYECGIWDDNCQGSINCGSSCPDGEYCNAGTCEPNSGCTPTTETCDGTDNDCDDLIDEDFPNLGDSCSVGVGECQSTGSYVCTANGLSTECNAVAGSPSTEICTGGLDEDCDGLTDENDPDCGGGGGETCTPNDPPTLIGICGAKQCGTATNGTCESVSCGTCSGSTPICNQVPGTCVECLTEADCGDGESCESNICVAQTVVNSGTIFSIWPSGAVSFFDSNDLPNDQNTLNDYIGSYYVKFPGSAELDCILILNAKYVIENSRSYIEMAQTASISASNNYEVWNGLYGCENG